MNLGRPLTFFAFMVFTSTTAFAEQICEPFGDSVEALPLIYLDQADPITARVAQSLEEDLLTELANEAALGPLTKVYCNIGMFELRIRFSQPVEDDAIRAIVTEAVYAWDSRQNPAGWMLNALNRQAMCARGDIPFAEICR